MRVLIPNCKILSCWDLGKTFGLPLFLVPGWTGSRESEESQVLRIEGGSALRFGEPADGGLGPCNFGTKMMHMHYACISTRHIIYVRCLCLCCPDLTATMYLKGLRLFSAPLQESLQVNCIAKVAGVDCKLALATARAGHA